MKIKLYNVNAKVVGELDLSPKTYAVKSDNKLIAEGLHVFLSNQRQNTAKAKNRNEVRGTTKKVWAQKGTGNARHGSRKAPIFVGGGVTHGPTGEQNFNLKFSKPLRLKVKKMLLSQLVASKSVVAIDKLSAIEPKSKAAVKLITGLSPDFTVLSKSQKIGILSAAKNTTINRAFANLPNVKLLTLNTLNIHDLASIKGLIASQKALKSLTK